MAWDYSETSVKKGLRSNWLLCEAKFKVGLERPAQPNIFRKHLDRFTSFSKGNVHTMYNMTGGAFLRQAPASKITTIKSPWFLCWLTTRWHLSTNLATLWWLKPVLKRTRFFKA